MFNKATYYSSIIFPSFRAAHPSPPPLPPPPMSQASSQNVMGPLPPPPLGFTARQARATSNPPSPTNPPVTASRQGPRLAMQGNSERSSVSGAQPRRPRLKLVPKPVALPPPPPSAATVLPTTPAQNISELTPADLVDLLRKFTRLCKEGHGGRKKPAVLTEAERAARKPYTVSRGKAIIEFYSCS